MKSLFFIASFALAACLLGQPLDLVPTRFAFDPEANYRSDLQSPAQFLGYELGTRFTEYDKSAQYFQYLAQASDRVAIREYGRSYEDRPLLTLVISSPQHLSDLETLRQRHLQLLKPGFANTSEGKAVLANDPVFTSLSYSIHGNEASTTEAAMQVAYRLAAVDDTETTALLDNSVILLYPCINPDGRDRYVYWINGAGRNIPGVNPNDLSHYEPWPNGRTNHYWFDLNRDWVWGVHPESRGHIAEYQYWMPQVHADYHEQGYNANYFTAPGALPRNLLLPDTYEAWSDTFGLANIATFNQQGISYFTRERFDFFYPGYGSSYPSTMGAIGMLTEQGGIGAGRAITTDDGYVLLFRQRIYDHYLTSMTTLRKAAEQREALLRYSVAAWTPQTAKGKDRTYIVRQETGGYLMDFLQVLLLHNIEVQQAEADFSLSDCLDYRTGRRGTHTFRQGDYLISTQQARHLLVQTLLERNMAIEDSVMYDMATWSAPLAYNLEAYSSTQLPKVKTRPLSAADAAWKGRLQTDHLQGQPAYAYIIDWQQRHAPKALALLWERGYRVRSADSEFSDGVLSFAAGSLIVLRGRNTEKEALLYKDMADIAQTAGVVIQAMPTGRMRTGYDLASPTHRPVDAPRLAMLVEPPFDTYTSGQVYFLFDHETGFPIDRIRTSAFKQTTLPKFGQRYGYVDINEYDVLVLPDADQLEQLFFQGQREEILAWLSRGGTLIAIESAAAFFTDSQKFGKIKLVKIPSDTSEAAKLLRYADRESFNGLRRIPGSALQGQIDTTHPLAFGVKPTVFGLKSNTLALEPDLALSSVGRYHSSPDELLTAGYASQENLQALAGKTFAGVQKVGEGQIVYLMDNPHFRMFWRGNSRMVQNAAFLLRAF